MPLFRLDKGLIPNSQSLRSFVANQSYLHGMTVMVVLILNRLSSSLSLLLSWFVSHYLPDNG